MALVILRDEVKKTVVSRKMPAPKKVTSLEHWFKGARKVVPEIPALSGGWELRNAYSGMSKISWEMFNTISQQRLYLIIDRTVPAIG